MSFTAFLAVMLHAILILGIGFTIAKHNSSPSVLEVTLTVNKSREAPEEADFLAQTNQQGSGTETEKLEMTTDRPAEFHSNVVEEVQLKNPSAPNREKNTQVQTIATTGDSTQKTPSIQNEKNKLDLPDSNVIALKQRSQEIASLEAKLRSQKQAYAKRPRIRQITSVSAKAHRDALYVDRFRQKVEEVASRNFPQRALTEKKFGSVRLLVAIKADGTVKEARILESSQYAFLDEAAIQSVRLAAPFSPFPQEIKKDTDILEIIRTWRFEEKQIVSSSF